MVRGELGRAILQGPDTRFTQRNHVRVKAQGIREERYCKAHKNGQGRLRGEGRAWKEFGRVEEGKGEHLSQLGTEARREGSLAKRKSFQNNHDNHKS